LHRSLDGAANSGVCPAAAKVAVHCVVDLCVGWIRMGRKQRGSRHDLTRLAVSTLRHVFGDPCLLYRMRTILRKALDSSDLLARYRFERCLARPDSLSVNVHRAGTAQAHPAAVFGTCQCQNIPQNPEKRRIWIAFEDEMYTVNSQTEPHVQKRMAQGAWFKRYLGEMVLHNGEASEGPGKLLGPEARFRIGDSLSAEYPLALKMKYLPVNHLFF